MAKDEIEPSARVYACLAQIPKGKVATYGQLGRLAGLGQAARFVGTCLRKMPSDTKLPWWRVINAQGKLSFPLASEKYEAQKTRLIDEGIEIGKNNKIDLTVFLWDPNKKDKNT